MRRSPKLKPRRRRRFVVNWRATLWFVALANVAAGLAWSPVTAVRKVRVTGATEAQRPRIEASMQTVRSAPSLRVRATRVETLIQQNPSVAAARFRRNLFGRGLLEVTQRRPVAVIDGRPERLLAEDGAVYEGQPPTGLPVVRLWPGALEPNLALLGPWEARSIARVCSQIASRFPSDPWTVEVDARGVIHLLRPQSARIVLGSSDRMDEKLGALGRVLRDRPGFLRQVRELNLTVPTNPVYVPLQGGDPQ